jgi:GntR family transcriptional regulator
MQDGLDFCIRADAPEPIYRQLMEHVRRRVAAGKLKAGDEMPSVRELAKQLAVNTMTISKAYALLESDGLLERRRGAAMRVSGVHSQPQSQEDRMELLVPTLKRAADEAQQLGLGKGEVVKLFEAMLDEQRTGWP